MNYSRQIGLIDPQQISRRSISIIGAGATGSHVALYLAQMGWGDSTKGQGILRVWDGDKVEEHNCSNQAYYPSQIGMQKVAALEDVIFKKCGFHIETHNEMVKDQKDVQSTYVFLLTDTMSSRKEIFDNCLKYSFNTDMVVETRMGLREGRIYAFNPNNPSDIEAWEKTLYKDEEAQVSLCGASASIIVTAAFVSSLAASRVVQHFNLTYGSGSLNLKENDKEIKIWNEVHFSLYPESFYICNFGGIPQITTL